MRFDVCVMNPPYNTETSSKSSETNRRHAAEMIHLNFLEKMQSMCDHVVVVLPITRWFFGEGMALSKKLRRAGRIAYAHIMSAPFASKLFAAKLNITGILHITTGYNDHTKIVVDGEFAFNADPSDMFYSGVVDAESSCLINKFKSFDSILSVVGFSGGCGAIAGRLPSFKKEGGIPIVQRIGNRDKPLTIVECDPKMVEDADSPLYDSKGTSRKRPAKYVDTWRMGINGVGSTANRIAAMKVIAPGMHTSYAVSSLSVDSKEQAENLIEYINSDVGQFIYRCTYFSSNNGRKTFEPFPAIDLNRKWTNKELFKLFELSDKEISNIKAISKLPAYFKTE